MRRRLPRPSGPFCAALQRCVILRAGLLLQAGHRRWHDTGAAHIPIRCHDNDVRWARRSAFANGNPTGSGTAQHRRIDGCSSNCRQRKRHQVAGSRATSAGRVADQDGRKRWVSSPRSPLDMTAFSEEELRAAVEVAQDWNTYVATHAYTPRAVQRALAAGVTCIEHAHLVDDETAK